MLQLEKRFFIAKQAVTSLAKEQLVLVLRALAWQSDFTGAKCITENAIVLSKIIASSNDRINTTSKGKQFLVISPNLLGFNNHIV